MRIRFEKLSLRHIDTIFNWLTEPHIQEFWDNTQDHKDDIIKFANGRKTPSDYCDGLYHYFIGYVEDEPYSLIMILQEKEEYNIPTIKKSYLSTSGSTYSIDFMIGNPAYFGRGFGAKTLEAFIEFVCTKFDRAADTFFIDPDVTNSRAKHVYKKAGFEYVGDFIMGGTGAFRGYKSHLMIKKISPFNFDERA